MTSLLLRQTFLYITRQLMQVKLCVVVKRSIILQSNKEEFLRIDVNIQHEYLLMLTKFMHKSYNHTKGKH